MRIVNLTLDEFQNHKHTDLSFGDGSTFITGQNGAGKSTLLRGIFGGLYQTDATTETSANYALADLVSTDADEGGVELTFAIGETEYTIEWVISISEDDEGERVGSTKTCVLISESLPEPIEGVRDVRETVERLLGMDAESFANSVYVQQKRFNRLIEASESERKEILDGLLGLDAIDDAIERTEYARRPIKRRRSSAEERKEEVQQRLGRHDIDQLESDRDDARASINTYEPAIEELDEKIEQYQRALDSATTAKEQHQENLDRRERLMDTIESKEAKIEELGDEATQFRQEIGQENQSIGDERQTIEAAKPEISDRHEAEEHRDRIVGAWTEARDQEQSTRRDLDELRSEREELAEETLPERRADHEEARDAQVEAEAAVDRAETRLADAREQRNAAVDERNQKTADYLGIAAGDVTDADRDAVEQAVDEADTQREALNERLATLQTKDEQHEDRLDALATERQDAVDHYETIAGDDDISAAAARDQYEQALAEARDTAEDINDEYDLTVDTETLLDTIETALTTTHGSVLDAYDSAARAAIDGDGDAGLALDTHRETLDAVTDLAATLARALRYRRLADAAAAVTELDDEREAVVAERERIETEREETEAQRDASIAKVETGETVLDTFDTVDHNEEMVDDITTMRDDARDDLNEADEAVEAAQEAIDDAEARVSALDTEISETETALARRETAREHLEAKKAGAEALVSAHVEVDQSKERIEALSGKIADRRDRISDIHDDIDDTRAELDTLDEELSGVDTDGLDEEIEKRQELVTQAKAKRSKQREQLRDARDALTTANERLESIQADRDRVDALDAEIETTTTLIDELTAVIEEYKATKLTLRERTLGLLNSYVNDVFEDLYRNESYTGVHIDSDYGLELYDTEGNTLDPDKGSGGEGVLVNLALRAGVYRVIAEQDLSAKAGLPPFILDEPTTYLDSKHVGRIEGVITSIREWDVSQVFVVTHRESLMHSADYNVHVSIDERTGRSKAEFVS
jgi:DNA repair exonuclease SbcCD ATPase subunit